MQAALGFRWSALAMLAATAYLCGGWEIGYFPAAIVMLGVLCVYCGARYASTPTVLHFRVIVDALGLVLIWCGSVDKIESIYMCYDCPVVRVNTSYRLLGATFHRDCYDTLPAGPGNIGRKHNLFLAARFRYFGLFWQQFTDDSPPPGIKKLVQFREHFEFL